MRTDQTPRERKGTPAVAVLNKERRRNKQEGCVGRNGLRSRNGWKIFRGGNQRYCWDKLLTLAQNLPKSDAISGFSVLSLVISSIFRILAKRNRANAGYLIEI